MAESRLLKKDLFGEIWQISAGEQLHIVRDASTASIYVRWLARRLMHREARVLAAMEAIDGVPQLISTEPERLTRSFLPGLHHDADACFDCWPTKTCAIFSSTNAAIAHSRRHSENSRFSITVHSHREFSGRR